ncbi:MAG: DUF5693 family protein [Limnochordia bacterium]|jgi:hypothetical protein
MGRKYGPVLFMILACLAALGPLGPRIALERADTGVELIMDYAALEDWAAAWELSPGEVLAPWAEAGLTTIALGPQTISTLAGQGDLVAVTDQSVRTFYALTGTLHPDLEPLVEEGIRPGAYLVFLKPGLGELMGGLFPGEDHRGRAFYSPLPLHKIVQQPLGYDGEVLALAEEHGLLIAPRPSNQGPVVLPPSGPLSTVIFQGEEVGGYPDHIAGTAQEIGELPLGLIEFAYQRGQSSLAQALDYRVVRVHSITPREMARYEPAAALDRYLRAVEERGARALYLRPFTQLDLEENSSFIGELHRELKARGYEPGPAEPKGRLTPHPLYFLLAGLGIAMAGYLLLRPWFPPRWAWLPLLPILGLIFLYFKGYTIWARQGLAFLGALVFPALALQGVAEKPGGRWLGPLLQIFGLSLLGGLVVASLLSETRFILKLQEFRGVKAAHLFPLLWLGLIYFPRGWRRKEAWKQPVRFYHGALAVLGAALLLVYLGRTGNTYLPVASLEIQLRTFLESLFGVRPRTKELLIGYPLLVLGLWLPKDHLWARMGRFFGGISAISVVNTFAHAHTPVLVSLARSIYGLAGGGMVGLLLILGWKWAQGRWQGLWK